MPKLSKAETSTVVDGKSTDVVEVKKREKKKKVRPQKNPDYEKAMAEVAKYVKETSESDTESIEFNVDYKAKVVVCRREKYVDTGATIKNEDGDEVPISGIVVLWGLSKCCPSDKFNPLLGKYIALKRARNRPIPNFIRSVVFGK